MLLLALNAARECVWGEGAAGCEGQVTKVNGRARGHVAAAKRHCARSASVLVLLLPLPWTACRTTTVDCMPCLLFINGLASCHRSVRSGGASRTSS